VSPPGDVGVVPAEKEITVQEFTHYGDVFDHTPAVQSGCSRHPEYKSRLIVLPPVDLF